MGAVARPNAPTAPLLAVKFDAPRQAPANVCAMNSRARFTPRRPATDSDAAAPHRRLAHRQAPLRQRPARRNAARVWARSQQVAETRGSTRFWSPATTWIGGLSSPPCSPPACARFEELAAVAPVVAVTGNHEDPLFWAQIAPYLAPRIRLAAADAVFPSRPAPGRLYVGCLPWPEPAEVAAEPGVDRTSSRGDYAAYARGRIDALAADLRVATSCGWGCCGAARAPDGQPRRRRRRRARADVGRHLCGGRWIAAHRPGLRRPRTPASTPTPAGLHRARPLLGQPDGARLLRRRAAPSVAVIDIDESGATKAREIPLTAGRRLVRLRGTLDELEALAAEHPGAWFFCEVVVEQVRLDLVRHVRERIPDALRVEPITPAGVDAGPTTNWSSSAAGTWATSTGVAR